MALVMTQSPKRAQASAWLTAGWQLTLFSGPHALDHSQNSSSPTRPFQGLSCPSYHPTLLRLPEHSSHPSHDLVSQDGEINKNKLNQS